MNSPLKPALSEQQAEAFMREALALATEAAQHGEVPIGAVVAIGDQIIGRGRNRVEELKDASAHAEMLALREASTHVDNWRLEQCSLIVTLEPCYMCLGAARLARVSSIYFGAQDNRFGALEEGSVLSTDQRLGPVPSVQGGILADECRNIIQEFFRARRKS